MLHMSEAVDSLYGGRFVLQARLGEGGMGTVYEAVDREHTTRVAVKTLRRLDPEQLLRFKAEFRRLQDLHHPNLVSLGELFEEQGRWFFTLELVRGLDFLRYVRAPGAGGQPFEERRLRGALGQLARGLHALHHAELVHRDIKPSNILVTAEGRVVLLDFGILAEVGEAQPAEELVGTAAYMAPEQVWGAAPEPAADWYSVGVLLYRALTGRLPFNGPSHKVMQAKCQEEPPPPQALVSGLPEDLCRLCTELLRLEPASRPSGQEVLRRLGVEQEVSQEVWASPALPFVGRGAERRALHQALADSRAGHSVVVCVQGESGVGKTRLVRHFLAELARGSPEAVVLSGRCYERESVPYKGVDGLVDSLALYLSGPAQAHTAYLVPEEAAPLLQLFPVLRQVPRVAALQGRALPEDPLRLRLAAFAALRELLARLAASVPVVLVVDDVQWAEADGLALLDELLQAPGLLLVATLRGEEAELPPSLARSRLWTYSRRLPLRGLPLEETRSLVELLLGEQVRLPAAAVERIAQESNGLPLFVEALVHHPWGLGGQSGAPRLEEALWARAERLDEGAHGLLSLLAVADGPLSHAAASRAVALEGTEYARATASLRGAHLAFTSGTGSSGTVEVVHDRVRQAVLRQLPEPERQGLHARLAVALEVLCQGEAETLALHWLRAGFAERAVVYYRRAAEESSQALAFARAARLYERVLELGAFGEAERRQLRVCQAEALAHAGRGSEAAQAFLLAAEGAAEEVACSLWRRAGEQYLLCGHVKEGLAAMRLALGSLGLRYPEAGLRPLGMRRWLQLAAGLRPERLRLQPPERLHPKQLERLELFGSLSRSLGGVDPQRAYVFRLRHLRLALRIGEPRHLCRALALSLISATTLYPGERQLVERQQRTLEAMLALTPAEPALQGFVASMLAFKEQLLGECLPSREHFEHALTLLRRCTGVYWETVVAWNAGMWALMMMGDVAELERRLVLPLAEARERGDRYTATTLQLIAGSFLLLARGDAEGARRLGDEAISHWGGQGYLLPHFQHLRALLQTELYEGKGEAVLSRLEQEQPRLEQSFLLRLAPVRFMLLDMRTRAALRVAARGGAQAEPLLRQVEADAREMEQLGLGHAPLVAELVRAGVAAARGERAISERYGQAASRLEEAGLHLLAAAARCRQGELLAERHGRALVQYSLGWMRQRGIHHPERLAALFAPPMARAS